MKSAVLIRSRSLFLISMEVAVCTREFRAPQVQTARQYRAAGPRLEIMEQGGGEPFAAIRLRSGPIISDQARRAGHVPKELKPHAGAGVSTRLLRF